MAHKKKNTKQEVSVHRGELLIYQTDEGHVRLDVRLVDESLWMTQSDMARLFQCSVDNISLHLKNIYAEGELSVEATTEEFSVVRKEGSRSVNREVTFYNLDAIISVGYRIKSLIATRFRLWATQRLREYIVKGFAMDDARLKEAGSSRYFEELLARIRDIRSSEKVFWRKILDIYATSIDYDPQSEASQLLFQQIQNKMHWAAHGHTAAELIHKRADAKQPNMGITNYPGQAIIKRDVDIAKNYLNEDELNVLNRIVTAYLEVAEVQALNRIPMAMADWIERLDDFLKMTGREILSHAGTISHELAMEKAYKKFAIFFVPAFKPVEFERFSNEAGSNYFVLSPKTALG